MNDAFKAFQDQFSSAFKPMDMPSAFREFAEKGVQSYREGFEKLKASAEQTSDMLEGSYSSASKGVAEYNLKSLEILRTNINSAFDFCASVLAAKTPAEAVELSSTHLRGQFEALSEQAKELSSLAQKIASESSEPIKAGVEKTLRTGA